jgi:hypothetical protein
LKTTLNKKSNAGRWWLTPVIPPTQEAEVRRIAVQSQPRQTVHKTLSCKILSKKKKKNVLVEWLKVKAPSSSPSTTHTKKKVQQCLVCIMTQAKVYVYGDRDTRVLGTQR